MRTCRTGVRGDGSTSTTAGADDAHAHHSSGPQQISLATAVLAEPPNPIVLNPAAGTHRAGITPVPDIDLGPGQYLFEGYLDDTVDVLSPARRLTLSIALPSFIDAARHILEVGRPLYRKLAMLGKGGTVSVFLL